MAVVETEGPQPVVGICDSPELGPIVAVDGHCMLAKCAFALPSSIRSPSGTSVNGLLGFGLMLAKLIEAHPSAVFVVVFDNGGRTYRHSLLPTYKQGRVALPEDFAQQIEQARRLSTLLDCDVIPAPPGYEADDVLATIAALASATQRNCTIVTADRDLLQVVHDPHVRVLLSRRGLSLSDAFDEALVKARWGVHPSQLVDVRALAGDASDAVPGLPGIGPKRAAQLVSRFGSVEGILAGACAIPGPLGERIAAFADTLRRNVRILRLATAAPVQLQRGAFGARWSSEAFAAFAAAAGIQRVASRMDAIALQRRTSRHTGVGPASDRLPFASARRVAIVGCSAHKAPAPALARDLYRSEVFQHSRAYAERYANEWWILSAKHGLLRPGDVIEPYDMPLSAASPAARQEWLANVTRSMTDVIRPSDAITILAADDYAKPVAESLVTRAFRTSVPLECMSTAEKLEWLTLQVSAPKGVLQDLELFYNLLDRLGGWAGGPHRLAECDGGMPWPKMGVYFFREPSESRVAQPGFRVTRVGTHAVGVGSRSTLWGRLRNHRGPGSRGRHRGSVFRLHVGVALQRAGRCAPVPTWGSEHADLTAEADLEDLVSAEIEAMEVLPLAIGDTPGPRSDRAFIESNAIALLTTAGGPVDPPTPGWLGRTSGSSAIRRSGLWNVDHVGTAYDARFLNILGRYVEATLGKEAPPAEPLAPKGWWFARRRVPGQSFLFPEVDNDR